MEDRGLLCELLGLVLVIWVGFLAAGAVYGISYLITFGLFADVRWEHVPLWIGILSIVVSVPLMLAAGITAGFWTYKKLEKRFEW